MKVVIFVLFLAVQTFAVEIEVVSIMEHIDQTIFGQTLLDTVWLQIQAQEPIEHLLNTLSDLEDDYIAEQKEDDAINDGFQNICSSDLSQWNQDLTKSDQLRISLIAKLESELKPRRLMYMKLIAQKDEEYSSLDQQQVEYDKQRDEQNSIFESQLKEHEKIIQIIKEAKFMFTENLQTPQGEEPFNQRTNKVHKDALLTDEGIALLQQHLTSGTKRANRFSHRKSWGKLFQILATILSRIERVTDQDGIQRVINLMDELIVSVQESLDLERSSEDTRLLGYKNQSKLNRESMRDVENVIASAQIEVTIVENSITQNEYNLDNVVQRIKILSEEREDRYKQCEQAVQDYQSSRIARDVDRQVVSDTIGLINQHARSFGEQLASRLAAS